MATLTVGAGQQFSTIAAAVAAAQDGDTVQVIAGTYRNNFATITKSITLEAVGGRVNLVATIQPPDKKGYFTVGNSRSAPDVTISGFTISGVRISGAAGANGAGIRYQSGNLTLINDKISGSQMGLLATPEVSGTGSITIDSSTFSGNGTRSGRGHNIYVNHVANFTITNSLIENAVVGHEIKSRALNTIIENNRILETGSATASYSIDLPNAGNALVQGNVIMQGAKSQNAAIITYGEEGSWQPGTLTVTGNQILSNLFAAAVSAVRNTTNAAVTVSDNQIWGISEARVAVGLADESGTIMLPSEPKVSTAAPWSLTRPIMAAPAAVGVGAAAPAPAGSGASGQVLLRTSNASIAGGTSRLVVTVKGSNDTVRGGSGGLKLTGTGGGLVASTEAGATDTLILRRGGVVHGAGTDTISISGYSAASIDVSGAASIHGGNGRVNVTGETGGQVTIQGARGPVTYTGNGAALTFIAGAGSGNLTLGTGPATIAAGAAALVVDAAGAASIRGGAGKLRVTGEAGSDVTIRGGAGTVSYTGNGGELSFFAGSGASNLQLGAGAATVTAGRATASIDAAGRDLIRGSTGHLNVTGEAGAQVTIQAAAGLATYSGKGATLSFIGGAGPSRLTLGDGAATVSAGAGNMTITGGNGPETIQFGGGAMNLALGSGPAVLEFVQGHGGGNDVIHGFDSSRDHLSFQGFAGNPITSQRVIGGSTHLVLSDGTQITFAGVSSLR